MTSWPPPSGFMGKLYKFVTGVAATSDGADGPRLAVVTAPVTPSPDSSAPRSLSPASDARTASQPAVSRTTAGSFSRDLRAADSRMRHPVYGDDMHHGDPDVITFPPSAAELEQAAQVIAGSDDADYDGFWETCQSVARGQAVLRQVEREAKAAALLARVDLK